MRTKQNIEAFFRRNTSHATGTTAVSALSLFGDFRSLNFLWMQEVPFMNFKGSLVDSGFYILPFSHFILLYINLLYWFHRKLHSLVIVYCSHSSVDCILRCLLCSFFVLFAHLVGVAKGLAWWQRVSLALQISDCGLFFFVVFYVLFLSSLLTWLGWQRV